MEDGTLDSFSHIEAAFIISGINNSDSLEINLNWYQAIIQDIKNKRMIDIFDKPASAEKLFLYLHTTWLITYKKEATTLLDIKQRKEFNCVSATILYNLTCDELGLSTMAFETPTHVYTIFTNFTQDIMVENTTSIGFNIIKNLDKYSRYMARYYPEKQIYKIGLHRLYAYENSKGRRITNIELLGLISYNQAYLTTKQKNYQQAYEYVLLAQNFNQDSRSNRKFEINLYYKWGNQLYDQKNFYQGFEVFADANYRYPDNKDFENNCIIFFFKALQKLWLAKNWETTGDIVNEIAELEILSDDDLDSLAKKLVKWGYYFYQTKQKKNGLQAVELLNEIGINENKVRELERIINSL